MPYFTLPRDTGANIEFSNCANQSYRSRKQGNMDWTHHPSHIAAFARSSSSFALASSSLARFRRLISFSFIARSYARCSSVRAGGRIPKAPAIILPATAVCFSGLTRGALGELMRVVPGGLVPAEGGLLLAEGGLLLVAAHDCWRKIETGVGGGAKGSSALLDDGEMTVLVSCSSSASDVEDSSSSQNSATWTFLVFGFVIAFLTIGLGTSGSGLLLLIDRGSKLSRRAANRVVSI